MLTGFGCGIQRVLILVQVGVITLLLQGCSGYNKRVDHRMHYWHCVICWGLVVDTEAEADEAEDDLQPGLVKE